MRDGGSNGVNFINRFERIVCQNGDKKKAPVFFHMVAMGVVAVAPQRRLRLDEEMGLKEAAGDINVVV
jgi:hypothetical protein